MRARSIRVGPCRSIRHYLAGVSRGDSRYLVQVTRRCAPVNVAIKRVIGSDRSKGSAGRLGPTLIEAPGEPYRLSRALLARPPIASRRLHPADCTPPIALAASLVRCLALDPPTALDDLHDPGLCLVLVC